MSLNELEEDSDDSLPSISEIFAVNHDASKAIAPGDIVWAKFKILYWPALVRTVYAKQKKISIWYADDPGKTFKVPLKNVCSFYDADKTAKIVEDAKKAGCFEAHEGLTSHAKLFLNRRAEGFNDDPMKFFDQTYPFFLVEEVLKKDPNADVANLKIPPLYLDHGRKMSRKTLNSVYEDSGDSEVSIDDNESTDNEVCDEEPVLHDYVKEINLKFRENTNSPTKNYADKIVNCILSGKADLHLKKVFSKTVRSDYYNAYEKPVNNGKGRNANLTYTGPIQDINQLQEISSYLLLLYEKLTPNNSKNTFFNPSFCDKKAQFVSSVFLPESIIFGISKIRKISLCKAKDVFKKLPRYDTKLFGNIINSLAAPIQETNCDPKNNKGKKEKREFVEDKSDVPIYPLKKLCVNKAKSRNRVISHSVSVVEEINSGKATKVA